MILELWRVCRRQMQCRQDLNRWVFSSLVFLLDDITPKLGPTDNAGYEDDRTSVVKLRQDHDGVRRSQREAVERRDRYPSRFRE